MQHNSLPVLSKLDINTIFMFFVKISAKAKKLSPFRSGAVLYKDNVEFFTTYFYDDDKKNVCFRVDNYVLEVNSIISKFVKILLING